jgi:hypothetical protein
MDKKSRNYGWSPEQLARINARREARGKDLYIDRRMGDLDYKDRYDSESDKYGAKATQRKPAFPSERSSGLDQYKAQKGLRERMAERGSLKDEMKEKNMARKIGLSVESEEEKRKKKKGMGISTPSIKNSFNRMVA